MGKQRTKIHCLKDLRDLSKTKHQKVTCNLETDTLFLLDLTDANGIYQPTELQNILSVLQNVLSRRT